MGNRQDAKSAKDRQVEPHPDDMLIGPEEWIRYIDPPNDCGEVVEIDDLLRPIESFWHALEVDCVAACCGIQAHSFLPKDIWNACRSYGRGDLGERLEAIRNQVSDVGAEVISSKILNQLFVRRVFLQLIDHIVSQVHRMKPNRD